MNPPNKKIIMISKLEVGIKFTLQGLDGIYVKMPAYISRKNGSSGKKERIYLGSSAYVKECNKDLDLFCFADKPVLKIIGY